MPSAMSYVLCVPYARPVRDARDAVSRDTELIIRYNSDAEIKKVQ
jgi:hypothetical protein